MQYLITLNRFFYFKNENKAGPNFEEQILEAAKSIAAVTKHLVQSTSALQRELVSQGRLYGGLSQEKQWSNKLVSCVSHTVPAQCRIIIIQKMYTLNSTLTSFNFEFCPGQTCNYWYL